MDVSVVIAVGREDFSRCIDSLLNQSGNFSYEVIAVGEPEMKAPPQNVKWLTIAHKNPALKRNLGAQMASGKILAFIDDDAYAPPDWLPKILDVLEANPAYAGIGGPNLAPSDLDDREKLSDAVLSLKVGSGSSSYSASVEEHEARIGEIHLVNFAVRKNFFEELGGFNEALGYGAEDSEFIYLAKRLQRAHFRYTPNIFVYHRRRKFGKDFLRQRFILRRQNGRLLWVRPTMYMSNPLFCAGILWAFFSLPFLILKPWVMLLLFLVYLMFLIGLSIRVRGVSKFRWIIAMILTHIVSVFGVLVGFFSVPSSENYARLARRP